MIKKISDNPIPDIHADWSNDKINNLPYSGGAVQDFIKAQLNSKAGTLYYNSALNTYMLFADEESKEAYINDPENNANKIIGSFAGQSIYYASIDLQSESNKSLRYGTTGTTIDFTFGIYTTKGNTETGDNIICTYTFMNGNKKKTATMQYAAGESVSFNIDKYIADMIGKIVVRISITGVNTQVSTTVSVIYNIYNIQLTDAFDITKLYNESLEIPYTLNGDGVKIAEFYVDGKQTAYSKNEDEITAATGSKTKYISTEGLSDGVHTLQIRAFVTTDNKKQYTDLLYREFFVCREATDANYIALSIDYPSETAIIKTNPTIPNIEQFMGAYIKFASYNNSGTDKVNVDITLDKEVLTTMECTNDTVYTYNLISRTSGTKTLKIGPRSFTITVMESSFTLSELTDHLTLALDASTHSNSSTDKNVWTFGNISATMTGFDWTEQSGWNNGYLVISNGASLTIPYAPLATDTAKTIEIEFSTDDVKDDDAVVCDMRNANGAGILITASKIELISRSSALSGISDTGYVGTRFKSGENYRISFVITPKTGAVNKCMAFVYVNGILSGATSFAPTDNFISDKQINIAGSEDCTIKLRQIRCYDKALGDDEILNNYILYRSSVSEMLNIYERNSVIENGSFSVSKLEGELPVAIITGNIPAIEATTDKKHVEYVDIDFYNLQDRTKSFSWKNVYMTPQGTSSMTYPRKNLRPYIAKKDSTKCFDADGKPYTVRKYSHITGGQPCDRWTWKADFAESSGTHNVGIAMLWNKVLYDSVMGGKYVFRTNAQSTAAANDFPYDVRTTVAGFPMVVFYRLTKDDDLVFMGKYNFLNDKSSESVFGFKGIEGTKKDGTKWSFDNSKVECWECLANKEDIALMKSTDGWDDVVDASKGTKRWQQSFEGRYPDGNTNDTALKSLVTWVASTKDNLAKWKAEKSAHFNLPLLCAYYVYLMRFGAVDQPVKNSMLTTEDGEHWFFINYDNDTINGVRNDGLLKYDPFIDRQSIDSELKDYCYAGHDSVLWNNFEADEECMNMVRDVDAALQQGGLTYEKVLKVFNNDFSSKWCERVYNQDAEYKYIAPYTDKGLNYLSSLQGSRKAHREWWLSQRFSLLDAKWVTGDFRADVIQFLIPADGIKQYNFSITAAQELYYGWGVNNVVKESGIHLKKGESHTFTTNQAFAIGDPVRIYAGPEISSVDIHEMGNVIAHLNINGAYSKRKGTSLEKLIIGGDGVENTALTSGNLTGLADCSKLKYLDIRGMKGLTDIDTANLSHLETLLLDNSGLTSLTLKNCPIASLSLPNSIIALDIEGLSKLNSLTIDTTALRTLIVKKCSFDLFDFLKNWTLDSKEQYVIDVEGINWKGKTTTDVLAIGQKIKAVGGTLKGRIEVDSITNDNYQQIMDVFGSNCLSPKSALYIYVKGSSFLVLAPKSIIEGRSGKVSVVGVADGTSIEYGITSGGDRATIDKNGMVHIKEIGSGDTITITTIARKGDSVNVNKVDISVVRAIYPTLTIDGSASIGEDAVFNVKQTAVSNQNTDYAKYEWSISGAAADDSSVLLANTNGNSTTINVVSNPPSGTTKAFIITLNGYKQNMEKVTITKDITLLDIDKIVCYDESDNVPEGGNTNAPLMKLAKDNNWLKKDGKNLWISDCSAVTSLPDAKNTLVKFDEFKYFTGITSFTFNAGDSAWNTPNKNLVSITIPSSVTELQGYCFNNCKSLISVTIPNSIIKIGAYCFGYCESLISIILPTSINKIEYNVFNYCKSLTSVFIRSNTEIDIGNSIFAHCNNIKKIYFEHKIPYSFKYLFDHYSTPNSNYGTPACNFYVPITLIDYFRGIVPNDATDKVLIDDRYDTYTYKSLTIAADDVIGNSTKTRIHYTETVTATKDGVSTDITWSDDVWSGTFEQNTSKTDTVQRTITYTRDGLTATTIITQGVWKDKYCIVNLNDQWRVSSDIANPDNAKYDGVYESYSNYNVHNGVATMSIEILGYDSFKVLIDSASNSNYGYVIVGNIDTQPTSSNYSYSTRYYGSYGGEDASRYKNADFTNLNKSKHTIYIAYAKSDPDYNVDLWKDRGYVLIPKNQ